MKRMHSFFRKTHKLLFSAVAVLLIISMLPTTILAADYTVEFTQSTEVSSNGTGKGSINTTTTDCHGTNGTSAGLRIYMVDKNKNILKDATGKPYIKDLLTPQAKTMYNSANEKGNYIRIGSTDSNPVYRDNIRGTPLGCYFFA